MEKSADKALIGRTIADKFAIDALLGRGSMGCVYRARHLGLDRPVALKVLHASLATDEDFVARFESEARAASRLDHPNSVRVIDFGSDKGSLYIAMEYLDGRDLFDVIQAQWPLSPERVAGIMMQALAAIAVAHDMGIVHRDLKPENLMVLERTTDDGAPTDVVKVCDFGIAKINTGDAPPPRQGRKRASTKTGIVMGTPEYMSPEQARGEKLDARSDLYSLGVILYELLTQKVPFEGDTALDIAVKLLSQEALPPSVIRPEVDERLEAICVKAMRKRREDRYQNAREMRADLRAIASGAEASVPPPALIAGVAAQAGPSARGIGEGRNATTAAIRPRHRWGFPLAVTLGCGVGAILAVKLALLRGAPPHAPTGAPSVAAVETGAAAASMQTPPSEVAPPDPSPPAVVASTSTLVTAARTPHRLAPTSRRGGATLRVAAAPATPAGPNPDPATKPADLPPSVPSSSPQSVPTPAAAPATPQPPPAPPFNLATASVAESVTHVEGVTTRDIRSVLPTGRFLSCYREALRATNRRLEGSFNVHIQTDIDGRITTAIPIGPDALTRTTGGCIAGSLSQVLVRNVDTGGASADVEIRLKPE